MLAKIINDISECMELLETYKNKKYDKFLFSELNKIIPYFYYLQEEKLNYITDEEFYYFYNYLNKLSAIELRTKAVYINKLSNTSFVQSEDIPKNKKDFYQNIKIFISFEKPYFKNPMMATIYKLMKDVIFIAIECNKYLIKNQAIKVSHQLYFQNCDEFESILMESLIRKLYSYSPDHNCMFSSYFFNEMENQTQLFLNETRKKMYTTVELNDSFENKEDTFKMIENKDMLITFLSFAYFEYNDENFNIIKENVSHYYKGTGAILKITHNAFNKFRKMLQSA